MSGWMDESAYIVCRGRIYERGTFNIHCCEKMDGWMDG